MSDLPFLDLTAPGFSTRSEEVLSARAESWCARTSYGLAVLRYRQAGMLLRDRRLRQGSHAWPNTVGISGSFAEFWKRSIISLEGSQHKTLRGIAQRALAPDYVAGLHGAFEQIAAGLLAGLSRSESFEMVHQVTEPFAGRAIALLLDRPMNEAAQIGHDASRLGLAMGPEAPEHEATVNAACDRLQALAGELIETARAGFVARLVEAARDAGVEDRQVLADLIVISIFGGVDTTRAQLAFAAHLFARHPDQWTWLRGAPDAIPQAIEEIIRTRPTTTWASREALEDIELDGVTIRAGETVHIFVHATGSDPEAGGGEEFDIRAARKVHFGFGGGAHHCLGQLVARTDMAAALGVMLRHWRAIHVDRPPEFLPDSGNTSPRHLWLRVDWDQA